MKKITAIACLALLAGCSTHDKPISELSNAELCFQAGQHKAAKNKAALNADVKEMVKRKLSKKECWPHAQRAIEIANRASGE